MGLTHDGYGEEWEASPPHTANMPGLPQSSAGQHAGSRFHVGLVATERVFVCFFRTGGDQNGRIRVESVQILSVT